MPKRCRKVNDIPVYFACRAVHCPDELDSPAKIARYRELLATLLEKTDICVFNLKGKIMNIKNMKLPIIIIVIGMFVTAVSICVFTQ
jgi:hypothetical protein